MIIKRRGQIAIFVIIALVLVGGVALIAMFPGDSDSGELAKPGTSEYFIQLIENIGEKCISEVSKKSGYYNIPTDVELSGEDLAFWYLDENDEQPGLDVIREEITLCVEEKILAESLSDFSKKNEVEQSSSELEVDVRIREDIIREDIIYFSIHYPTILRSDGTTTAISDFDVEVETNFLALYDAASDIVNGVAAPSFDFCSPDSDIGIDFNLERKGDLLYVSGTGITNSEQFKLNFVIDRPLEESFGNGRKKLAVLYQDNAELPTFGGTAREVIENMIGNNGVDYFDCSEVPNFLAEIEDYQYAIITGRLQYQIAFWLGVDENYEYPEEETGIFLYGCNEFNDASRKIRLKNWVNDGGVLWINDVSNHEADKFALSYIGSLGYEGSGWVYSGSDTSISSLQDLIVQGIEDSRKTINKDDIALVNHRLLNCPTKFEFEELWVSTSLKVTDKDEVIIGDKDNAYLWVRTLGEGVIIFDEFLMKDNLFERLPYEDDIYSKYLAENYTENVLHYMIKFDPKRERKVEAIEPNKGELIEGDTFYFNSFISANSYEIEVTNSLGYVFTFRFNPTLDGGNLYSAVLSDNDEWASLPNGLYEWQVIAMDNGKKYISNIETFRRATS